MSIFLNAGLRNKQARKNGEIARQNCFGKLLRSTCFFRMLYVVTNPACRSQCAQAQLPKESGIYPIRSSNNQRCHTRSRMLFPWKRLGPVVQRILQTGIIHCAIQSRSPNVQFGLTFHIPRNRGGALGHQPCSISSRHTGASKSNFNILSAPQPPVSVASGRLLRLI